MCLEQLNHTKERQILLEEFRHQARLTTQANMSLNADRILPLATNSTFESSDLFHPSNLTSNYDSQTNWTDMIYDNLLASDSPNLTQFPTPVNQYNQSVHNLFASNLPVTNATTLATIISQSANGMQNLTSAALNLIFADLQGSEDGICRRETSLLFLLLMLGTVWMAVSLFNFNKTYEKVACNLVISINNVILFPITDLIFKQANGNYWPIMHFHVRSLFSVL